MPFLGEISALITAVLWSFTSIFFSEAAKITGSMQLNINRLLIAVFLLSSTIFIFGLAHPVLPEQGIYLGLSGLIGLVIGDAFLFKSYLHIGPRMAMLLMALSPGMALVLSYIFLHEQLPFIGILGIVITIVGISVVVLEKRVQTEETFKVTPYGLFLGFMGAVGQAVGLILAKLAFNMGEVNGFVATFIRIVASVIVFFPMLLILGKYKNPVRLYRSHPRALAFTIGGSIVGPFLGITFSLIAVSNAPVGIASTLMSTMPILMIPLMRIFYKEKVTMRGVIGTVIAIGGIALLFVR